MIRVYTHENRLLVWNVYNLLQNQGIDANVLNDYAGGGVGDLSVFETWPQLWIKHETDLPEATRIVAALAKPESDINIICQQCGEENPESFTLCWCCETAIETAIETD